MAKDRIDLIQVKDHRDLARDPASKAVLNTNKKAYLLAVRAKREKSETVDEIQQLKDELSELKDMVKQLLGKVE